MHLTDYITQARKITAQQNEQAAKLKIALLRSYSCENIAPILQMKCYEKGYFCDILFGQYNQYMQEVLDPRSFLYRKSPNIVILALKAEDVCPELFASYYDSPELVDQQIETVRSTIHQLLLTLSQGLQTSILIHGFVPPYYASGNLYNSQNKNGTVNIIRKLNIMLLDEINSFSSAHFLDIGEIVAEIGRPKCYDLRMWEYAKNPYTFEFYERLVTLYADTIGAIYGKRKKCIVLDLDDTLWKGVAGEDGLSGISVTLSHVIFQQMLRQIAQTGILLCVNSKNNPEDAIEILDQHPDMVLRENDFTVLKINWQDKVTNLLEIADELNIGLDSLIFIDDSPAECQLVATKLPQVDVILLPDNILLYPDVIKGLGGVNFLELTKEDKDKVEQYRQQQHRESLKAQSLDLESFYASLNMELTICAANDLSIPRIAQLTQKTNQFNLTTKRYSADDLRGMLKSGYHIFGLNVQDRFGDNGLTAAAIVISDATVLYIDTFLLSCRIMGRTVETAFMSFLADYAKSQGLTGMRGAYLPTQKNKPVEGFYASLGFRLEVDGYWYMELATQSIPCPDYFSFTTREAGN